MKCPNCNKEINTDICEFCGYDTSQEKLIKMLKDFMTSDTLTNITENLVLENQVCKMICWSLGAVPEGFKALKEMEREIEGKPSIYKITAFIDKNHREKVVELTDKIVDHIKKELLTPLPTGQLIPYVVLKLKLI